MPPPAYQPTKYQAVTPGAQGGIATSNAARIRLGRR